MTGTIADEMTINHEYSSSWKIPLAPEHAYAVHWFASLLSCHAQVLVQKLIPVLHLFYFLACCIKAPELSEPLMWQLSSCGAFSFFSKSVHCPLNLTVFSSGKDYAFYLFCIYPHCQCQTHCQSSKHGFKPHLRMSLYHFFCPSSTWYLYVMHRWLLRYPVNSWPFSTHI